MVLVINFCAWSDFLLAQLLPDAKLVQCDIGRHIPKEAFSLLRSVEYVILNVDLTKKTDLFVNQEEFYVAARNARVKVLNYRIDNLDKTLLQLHLKKQDIPTVSLPKRTPDHTPVIIKTRANYGGEPERRIHKKVDTGRKDAPGSVFIQNSREYFVCSYREAKALQLDMNTLCIERYITNSEDYFYRVYIFGENIVIVKAHSDKVIKKIEGDERDLNCYTDRSSLNLLADIPEIPEQLGYYLERLLNCIEIDFGSMDIVSDGKSLYLVDLNTTPWGGQIEIQPEILEFLRAGLRKNQKADIYETYSGHVANS